MVIMGDEEAICFVGFLDKGVGPCKPGFTSVIEQAKKELELYFLGQLSVFKVPLILKGTPFQKQVWSELQKIPFGETRSYAFIAAALGKPTAYRAVAQANRVNPISIIVPCHRVIYANGDLGGYAGGLSRKTWLLQNECKADLHRTSFEGVESKTFL